MQWSTSLALTQRFNKGRYSLAVNLLVLIFFKAGGGGGHRNQNPIEPIQETGIRHRIASAVEAGVVDQIAKFSQPSGAGGGADNLVALAPEMGCDSGSDISTTHNPETARHAWSNTFYRI